MFISDTLSRAPEVESLYKIEDIEKIIKEIEAVNFTVNLLLDIVI